MKPNSWNRIVAVVDDLFFAAKIGETAKRAGVGVEFATSEEALLEKAAHRPSLIIVDLNLSGMKPLPLIAKLKSHPDLKQTSILGFVSHVQGELKQDAHKAGCDMVLARSSFSQNLPQILRRHGGRISDNPSRERERTVAVTPPHGPLPYGRRGRPGSARGRHDGRNRRPHGAGHFFRPR